MHMFFIENATKRQTCLTAACLIGAVLFAMLPSLTEANDDNDDEAWERVSLSGSHQEQQFLAGERVEVNNVTTEDDIFAAGNDLNFDTVVAKMIVAAGASLRFKDINADDLILAAGASLRFEDVEAEELILAGGELSFSGQVEDDIVAATCPFCPIHGRLRLKEIAQIGAAIGREFSYELIAAVAPLPYTQVDEALSQLTESGLAFRRGTPPEAIYTFKHALVQDAAYDSLLKSTRQELHAKIGRVVEEKFPDIEETEPVVLAHHYTEAGLKERAISYWWKAGDLAQQRVALAEGIHYYERGLALVKELRPSDSSETHELKARALLGMGYIGLYGYTHPQVTATLKPALTLKKALTSGGDYTLRVLWGLWVSTLCSGQAERSLQWVDRLISTAEQQNSQNMRHAGHWAGCNAHLFLGNFDRCMYHADNILANYDPDRDRQIANLISHDPKTIALAYKANAEWCLGYVDRALASGEAAISNARHWNHYFDLCWVSSFLSHTFFANLGQADKIGSLLDEAEQIASKQKVLFFRDIYCPLGRACWLLRSDRMNEAETQLGDAIAKWSGAGMQICVPMLNAFHAEAMLGNGHTDSALSLLDEAEEQIGRPGHGERSALSEVLRIRGRALAMEGKLQRAEEEVRRSLMVAEDLKAKSFELRSASDLARLLFKKGQKDEGLRIVKPVYDWFREGCDTKDLKEAKALLDELST